MILLIAIVLGGLVGAAAGNAGAVLAGALFGWLVVRSLRQQREIDTLRAHRNGWRTRSTTCSGGGAGRGARRRAGDAERDSEHDSEHDSERHLQSGGEHGGERGDECGDERNAAFATAASTLPNVAGEAVPVAPPRDVLAPVRRWLFGGNAIVKAGVGILFVGLAFLAKYASEHAHLPIEYRLGAIGLAAIVLLGFGWRLRLKRPDYAQVLQGGAVAVLYLTLFAAFRFYGVIGAMPAFVLMVAVAALAAALAVLQDARSLAIIGALGGFATPLIRPAPTTRSPCSATTSCSTSASPPSRGRRRGGRST